MISLRDPRRWLWRVPAFRHLTKGLDCSAASLFLLCALAFTLPLSHSLSRIVLTLLLGGALWLLRVQPGLWRNPVIIASFVWLFFITAMALRATLLGPDGEHIQSLGKHGLLALVPVVGLHAALVIERRGLADADLGLLLLACGSIGAAILVLHDAEWSRGLAMFAHYNSGGSGFNRNFGAFLAGMSLIGLLTLSVLTASDYRLRPRTRWPLACAMALMSGLDALALVSMESRANWIAAGFAAPVWLLVLLIRLATIEGKTSGYQSAATAVLFFVPSIAIALFFLPEIEHRMTAVGGSSETLRAILALVQGSPHADVIHFDPRFQLIRRAVELIRANPIFGWGPDVSMLPGTVHTVSGPETHTQFHNGYLQLIVHFGIVGLALTGTLAFLIVRQWWTHRHDALPSAPHDVARACATAAAVSLLVYMAVVNLTESIIFVNAASLALAIILGVMCSRGFAAGRSGSALSGGVLGGA